jgi:hypothetical protein
MGKGELVKYVMKSAHNRNSQVAGIWKAADRTKEEAVELQLPESHAKALLNFLERKEREGINTPIELVEIQDCLEALLR